MRSYVMALCALLWGATSLYAMHPQFSQFLKQLSRGMETQKSLHSIMGNDPRFNDNWRMLHHLVANGDVRFIHHLCKEWHNECDAKTGYGWNPLHIAAACGNNAVAVLLTYYAQRQGKDILSAVDLDGRTPILVAEKFRNMGMFYLLSNERGILKMYQCELLQKLHPLKNPSKL